MSNDDFEQQHEQALYDEAVGRTRDYGKVSVSLLQRSMRLGFTSALRLIERMEREGVVSSPDTIGKRTLLAPLPARRED